MHKLWNPWYGGWFLTLLCFGTGARGQTCQTAGDIDAPIRAAVETTAKRYFEMVAHGQSTSLQQNAIPSLASSFGGVEGLIKENQPTLSSTTASVRTPFLLTAEGGQPLSRAEFLCGVFGATGQTRESAVFVLTKLPPGKYAVVMLDATGTDDARALTMILQQIGADWKLAGVFIRAGRVGGHDSQWFAERAREFRTKGKNRNAWLYFREAILLATPADFMSTMVTDKLYDEAQSVQPSDLPVDEKVVDLTAGGATYKLTAVFPMSVGSDLDLVVRYQVADISNSAQVFQTNTALIKALVAKYPEMRDAFAGVVARAVDPSGQDFGTMLPMKEVK
jgi:hypothetical protein